MPEPDTINLITVDSRTRHYVVRPDLHKASINIAPNTTDHVGTSWVVIPQWNNGIEDDESAWVDYPADFELSNGTRAFRNMSVTGAGNIRFKVSTADDTADPAAPIYVVLS